MTSTASERIVAELRGRIESGELSPGDLLAGDWFVPFASIGTALGVTAPPVLLGLYVGARRRLMESLRERADSLERELQLLAERAEERMARWPAMTEEERYREGVEIFDQHRPKRKPSLPPSSDSR